jgi:hypothetical protein
MLSRGRASWLRQRPHPSVRRYLRLELSPGAPERAPAALASFHASIAKQVADIPAEHREVIQALLESAADVAGAAAAELTASGRPR